MEITNITQLRQNLLTNLSKFENKEITVKEAKAISEVSAKIMSSCKLEIGYAKHHNQTRKIEFLEP